MFEIKPFKGAPCTRCTQVLGPVHPAGPCFFPNISHDYIDRLDLDMHSLIITYRRVHGFFEAMHPAGPHGSGWKIGYAEPIYQIKSIINFFLKNP